MIVEMLLDLAVNPATFRVWHQVSQIRCPARYRIKKPGLAGGIPGILYIPSRHYLFLSYYNKAPLFVLIFCARKEKHRAKQ
jgi:hypothetical protein